MTRRGSLGYGIDQPRTIAILFAAGVIGLSSGLIVNRVLSPTNPRIADTALGAGLGIGGLILLVVAALIWSSRIGKMRQISKLTKAIPWGGTETVLDLGCGRGAFSVAAATRLSTGAIISLDLWRKRDVTGNDPRSLMANADGAHVGDKVTPVKGDIRVLPFSNESFDAIISAMALERLGRKEVDEAVGEINRVLKKGGRLAVLDTGRGHEFSDMLKNAGMRDVNVSLLRLGLFPPAQTVMARKPFVKATS
ncbi:MAG TPA: class I SAM-dependent methyltransferase [Nitrososphaerales archaeon]|nr:class I SAM-dependent methyltransferase [Nitrososphaerales archaeon]